MALEIHQVALDDGVICLNVEKNVPFLVDAHVAEGLDWLSHGAKPAEITQQIARQYGTTESERVGQVINQLERDGLLGSDGLERPAGPGPNILTAKRDYTEQYTLARHEIMAEVLHLTDKCNFQCDYCYFREKALKNFDRLMTMSPTLARQAVDLLLDSPAPLKHRSIWFFGGEPLLALDLLKSTVDYAEQQAARHGIRMSFGIFTNGALLTDKVIDYLIKHRVAVQVSLDGPPELNDQARRAANGEGTQDQVLQNCLRFLKRSPHKFSVRATLTHQNLHLVELVQYFLDLGFEHIMVEKAVAPVGASYALTAEDNATLLAEYSKLAELYLDRLLHGQLFNLYVLTNLILRLHAGIGWQRCLAGTAKVTIAPDGSIYSCPVFIGSGNSLRIGDVENGLDPAARTPYVVDSWVGNMATCQQCWARYLCGGGCRYSALISNGAVDRPHVGNCELLRHETELALKLYANLRQKNPGILDELERRYGDAELSH